MKNQSYFMSRVATTKKVGSPNSQARISEKLSVKAIANPFSASAFDIVHDNRVCTALKRELEGATFEQFLVYAQIVAQLQFRQLF